MEPPSGLISLRLRWSFLEVGIVLATIAILLTSRKMLAGASLAGAVGVALTANGFLMLV
jgi:hypothetical protein